MQLHIGKHAGKIFDVKFLITLICKTHPELLKYIQSVDKETKVCNLSPLKRHSMVTKIFEVNSNNISLEIEHFLT